MTIAQFLHKELEEKFKWCYFIKPKTIIDKVNYIYQPFTTIDDNYIISITFDEKTYKFQLKVKQEQIYNYIEDIEIIEN